MAQKNTENLQTVVLHIFYISIKFDVHRVNGRGERPGESLNGGEPRIGETLYSRSNNP